MARFSAKIRNKAEQFYEWVLPREVELSDFLVQTLALVYNGMHVEWKSVKFHFGLPWFMHYATNEASTQPGTYDGHSIHVYYRKSMWSPYSIRGLSTIVHECFHVMQYRQVLDGWGVGYFRFFLILYFSGYASLGRSRKHLIELPAYSEEDKFRECLENALAELGITDPEESFYDRQEEVLAHFKGKCPDISPHAYKIKFWDLMYALTPGAFKFHNYYFGRILLFPWMIIWNLIALAATILFAILKPILESILLIGYLIMLTAAGACALVGL
jgi:hypothetical protein